MTVLLQQDLLLPEETFSLQQRTEFALGELHYLGHLLALLA